MASILVIDDEPSMTCLYQEILEQAGYDVLVARNGLEGLRLFRQTPADLVITDLFMPQKDGLEVIMSLRREKPMIPIIAITGNAGGRHFLNVSKQLGAQHTMTKPFSATVLIQAVQQQLQAFQT